MHQHPSFRDFEEFEAAPTGSPGRWIAYSILFAIALVTAAGAGYGLGRGTLTVPRSVTEHIPAPLLRWLPASSADSVSADTAAVLGNYSFELSDRHAKQGEAVLTVRLVHKPTGKSVSDAVVFARRLDMAPAGMPTMTAELEPQPATERGVYRFKTDLTMAGEWRLSLAAKVQGETGTVRDQLEFKAVP